MSVLLLRLAGPMQSWGMQSRFRNRDTRFEPSRSGVIGLLCAALGWPRDHSLDDFHPLKMKMAVRVDRPGRLMRDYHTAQSIHPWETTKTPKEAQPSERYYLADADFLVGLEGEREFLIKLETALRKPVWVLSLGRKSFVPSLPVAIGIDDRELIKSLKSTPWIGRNREKQPAELRFIVEVPFGQGEPRPDVPLSFVSRDRKFAVRHVITEFHPTPKPDSEAPNVPQQADA